MKGNKIDIKQIGVYEIEIAKCGWLRLVWFAHPENGSWYEIQSNGQKVFETNLLRDAAKRYNDLIQ